MTRRSLSVLLVALTLIVSPTVALAAAPPSTTPDAVTAESTFGTGQSAGAGSVAAGPIRQDPTVPSSARGLRTATVPPRFETVVPEPELVPGVEQELTVQLLNEPADPGDQARPARGVEATVTGGDGPVEVVSGPRILGTVQEGRPATLSVRVRVPAAADPGSYRLPVELSYEHRDDDGDIVENSTTVYATVRVDERPRFTVVEANTNAPVGDAGTVTVTMENVGSAPATDASVTLQSQTGSVLFGESPSTSQFVGDWAPGETRTLEFDVSVLPSAERRNYPLQAVVSYDDQDGVPGESRPVRFGVTPLPEQGFEVRNVQSELYVGEEGTVTAEVVNAGERRVENVVVLFEPNNPRVTPSETQFAIGSLEPGESVRVSFDASVSDAAEPGPRQFELRVQYRNADGEQRASDPLDLRVDIGAERPAFRVSGVGTTITAGSSGTVELEITNNRDEILRDVSPKLFADAPITATDDEAFVQELQPGESTTVVFGISVDGSALEKTYPVEVDFQYDDADGDSFTSRTYQVPIEVREPDDGGGPLDGNLPVVAGALLVVLVLAAGGYLYVRGE